MALRIAIPVPIPNTQNRSKSVQSYMCRDLPTRPVLLVFLEALFIV
jgi:hypothetical protein